VAQIKRKKESNRFVFRGQERVLLNIEPSTRLFHTLRREVPQQKKMKYAG